MRCIPKNQGGMRSEKEYKTNVINGLSSTYDFPDSM